MIDDELLSGRRYGSDAAEARALQMIHAGVRVRNCAACGEPIGEREYIEELGLVVHAECYFKDDYADEENELV
jgi:hypothetical protein